MTVARSMLQLWLPSHNGHKATMYVPSSVHRSTPATATNAETPADPSSHPHRCVTKLLRPPSIVALGASGGNAARGATGSNVPSQRRPTRPDFMFTAFSPMHECVPESPS